MAKMTKTQARARLPLVEFALADIQNVLAIWRDDKPIHDPYMVEKWAEFDKFVGEKYRLLAVLG